MPTILLIAILLGLVLILFYLKPQRLRLLQFFQNNQQKKLEQMCFGDKHAAYRLMQGELKKNPDISKKEAYRRAAEKLRRHRK